MSMSGIFARIVALIGAAALAWRRRQGAAAEPAWAARRWCRGKTAGRAPDAEDASARGWSDGQKPVAAPGLEVNAFATGLNIRAGSRCCPMATSCGRVEPGRGPGPERVRLCHAGHDAARRALGVSANRITLLRDRDGDGVAETRGAFMEGLSQPFGMALVATLFMSATPTAWSPSPMRRARTASPPRGANS